jgi:putative transposase
VTTQRKHLDAVADNLLNMNFNPVSANEVWAGDVTYLKTGEGWMYLAVVMDLYSRRIVGWHIDKRMTTDLISRALMKAYNLRQPARVVVFTVNETNSMPVSSSTGCFKLWYLSQYG